MASGSNRRVLVTGISGYLGCHVAAELAKAGYSIRGTVRDNKWDAAIRAAVGTDVEFVVVDLASGSLEEWTAAAQGCTFVCHVASPFYLTEPKDPNDIIVPAVEGTTKVLRACHAAKVKRVALTSSTVAIGITGPKDEPFTEADWNDPETAATYPKSKILAERAAWDYANEVGLELVVLNPSGIFGPPLLPRVGETGSAIKRIVERDLPGIPALDLVIVDVRDVALAHVRALEVPEAVGNRYILCGGNAWMMEVANWLKEAMEPEYNPTTNAIPYAVLWVFAFFDGQARAVKSGWKVRRKFDTAAAARDLGLTTWRPMNTTVVEMAKAMDAHGLFNVKKKR